MSLFKYPDFIKDRFKNQEVHVVASGPSLIGFDYNRLKGKKVIAINHAYKLVDHDFCVFTDKGFCLREDPEVLKKTVCVSRYNPDALSIIAFQYAKNFTMDPADGVWHRRSSGSIGVCTALQGGASKVFMYGIDCKFLSPQEANQAAAINGGNVKVFKHIYGHSTTGIFNHPRDEEKDELTFSDNIKFFAAFPKDKIINMSAFSAIPYFEFSKGPYPS